MEQNEIYSEVQKIKQELKAERENIPFFEFLKLSRLKKAYTQKEIAFKLGITYQTYQKYEYGFYRPKPSRLKILSKLLDFSADFVFQKYYL